MKKLLNEAVDGLHHLVYGGDEDDEKLISNTQKRRELLPWFIFLAFIIFLSAYKVFKQ